MIDEKNTSKIEELLSNEKFTSKLLEAKSKEEMYSLLCNEGVEISFEEFSTNIDAAYKALVQDGAISEDGELSESLLEMVSGGRLNWRGGIKLMVAIGGATASFALGLPALGALYCLAAVAVASGC